MWKRWENRGLAVRFAAQLVTFGTLAFVAAGVGIYWLLQETATVDMERRLTRVADRKARQIEVVLDDSLKQATVISRMPDVARFLEAFSGVPITTINPIEYETRHAALRTLLKGVTGYADLMLLSPGGELLFSIGRTAKIGTQMVEADPALSSVWARAAALLQPQRSGLQYDFSVDRLVGWSVAPVVRAQATIGSVILRMPPDLLDPIVLDPDDLSDDLGETGEVMILSGRQDQALLLTPTRHDPNASRTRRIQIGWVPEDFSVRESVSWRSGFGRTVDYRGTAVTALWRPLPSVMGGLVVKIDVSETAAPMARMKQTLIQICGAISLLLVGVAWLMSRSVVKPVADLSRMVHAVSEGRFSETTPLVGAVGEMRELALAFQTMSVQVQKSYQEATEKMQGLAHKVNEIETAREGMRQEIVRLQTSEAHLSSIGTTLKSQIDSWAEQTKQQVGAIADANVELAHFAHIATHDLQEPLRIIASYTQLLAKRYKGHLDANADQFIDYVTEGAERMKQTLTDLADYAEADAEGGVNSMVLCDAGSLFQGVLQELQQMLHLKHEANVSYDPLPTITADPQQITKLFRHLIDNAFKFSNGPTPKVHVSVEVTETATTFSIADNGIGIESQYFDRIFQSFQRLNPHGKYPGTGVGLAVCKRIVNRHHGKIWVESVVGEGSTFKFSLPKVMGVAAIAA